MRESVVGVCSKMRLVMVMLPASPLLSTKAPVPVPDALTERLSAVSNPVALFVTANARPVSSGTPIPRDVTNRFPNPEPFVVEKM
jgi:hypothetical protein